MKRYTITLVLLAVTLAATSGSFHALSEGLLIHSIEKRSSSGTSSHVSGITLTLSQNNITIVRGSPAQLDIRIGLTPSGSFRVILSAQRVPSGVTVSFSPTSARISFVSTMTIISSNASSLGHSDLMVVASGGGVTRIVSLSILEVALVHDLAVISAVGPPTATVGKIVIVNATVANYGSVSESYVVNLYANGTLVATESSAKLLPSMEGSTVLTWNTTGFAVGAYGLLVAIPPVPGELDVMDNRFPAGSILLVQPTGNPAPNPSSGSPQPVSANWRGPAIAVAVVWIIVVALVFFRGTLRRAVRKRRT